MKRPPYAIRPFSRAARRYRRRVVAESLEDRTLLSSISLVRDIDEAPRYQSYPVAFSNGVLFPKFDAGTGNELWKSDGTVDGTVLVKDISPGAESSSLWGLTQVGDDVFFTAHTPDTGYELWKTDGTETGTVLVREILPGHKGFYLDYLTEFNGSLLFTAHDDEHGRELWISDGTADGTSLLKDIYPGPDQSYISLITTVGSVAYFQATDPVNGSELWKTDGTPEGTVLVGDINAGDTGSFPAWLTPHGQTLYFVASDGLTGRELWKINDSGSPELVLDVATGPDSSSPSQLYSSDEHLLFAADDGTSGDELWRSDGTTSGTAQLGDLSNGVPGSAPADFETFGGAVYFSAEDPEHGRELWVTDGTSAGTQLAFDFLPGEESSAPWQIRAHNGSLYFAAADDRIDGASLWKSDGTPGGTEHIADLHTYSAHFRGQYSETVVPSANGLFFIDEREDAKLWVTDGSPDGTTRVADVSTGNYGSYPLYMTEFDGKVLFAANTLTEGEELWMSDGTRSGTVMLKDIQSGPGSSDPSYFYQAGEVVYFGAETIQAGTELWVTDGTEDGTNLVADLSSGPTSSNPFSFTLLDGLVYFSASTPESGRELWRTDGTTEGTELVADLRPGTASSNPSSFQIFDDRLFFAADDGTFGKELWVFDPLTESYELVKDIEPDALDSSPNHLNVVNDQLLFVARTEAYGSELWVTDGTEAGTSLVRDIRAGDSGARPAYFTQLDGYLFFTATDDDHGNELWRTDGTTAGTTLVKDIASGTSSSYIEGFLEFGGSLFFSAGSVPFEGPALWKTDGTEEGTVLVKDLFDGYGEAYPRMVNATHDRLFFVGTDGYTDVELWETDGTADGTALVQDLNPWGSINPYDYLIYDSVVADGTLFISATDGFRGTELFKVTTPGIQLVGGQGLSVSESGSSASFDVMLTAKPSTNVILNVGKTGSEISLSPSALTFTPSNWDVAQSVTVMGEDDELVDGDQITEILLEVDPGSDSAFINAGGRSVEVTTTDDEEAGFLVETSASPESVTEGGSSIEYSVQLTSGPLSDVVINVLIEDSTELQANPLMLTFSPDNWLQPQAVSVAGVDDDVVDGDQNSDVTFAVSAESDPAFAGLVVVVKSITTTDDDDAGIDVAQTAGSTVVGEDGTQDTFTIRLTRAPQSSVVLAITSDDIGEVITNPDTLTFTAENWAAPQTVEVTGVDDLIVDGLQTGDVVISVDESSDAAFRTLPDTKVEVTNEDDDLASVTLEPTSVVVSESATTDTFSVSLGRGPLTSVVIDVTPSDPSEILLSRASLTFTPENWSESQNVVVTGVNDHIVDGDIQSEIVLKIDADSDPAFAELASSAVVATTEDDDEASFSVSPSELTIAESASASFEVSMPRGPISNVIFKVDSVDSTQLTTGVTSLTFTPENWSTPQIVTVNGVSESILDGDQIVDVKLSVEDGSDTAFRDVLDQTVKVLIEDDDLAGVLADATSIALSESGDSDEFTVTLRSAPLTNVTVFTSVSDSSEGAALPTSLTFTPESWNEPQTVVVSGIDDDLVDGTISHEVHLSVSPDSDPAFLDVTPVVIDAQTEDNDEASFELSVSELTIGESGNGSFVVTLPRGPISDVVLAVESGDISKAVVVPALLTFTPADWSSPRTVSVSGVDNLIVNGNTSTAITVGIEPSSDAAFHDLPSQHVQVAIEDDDVAGLTISPSAVLVSETGTHDLISIRLERGPLTDVLLSVTSWDESEATVSVSSLTFTPENWDRPQHVEVTGVNDDLVDGDTVTEIEFVAESGSDASFADLAPVRVLTTTEDDDEASFQLSVDQLLIAEADQAELEISLPRGPASNVVFRIESADEIQVTADPALVTFTPDNWATPQVVTVVGVDDALVDGLQVTNLTVSVDSASATPFIGLPNQAIEVTTTDNDTPGFTLLRNSPLRVVEYGSTATFSVVLNADPASVAIFSLTTDGPDEVVISPSTLRFTGGNWDIPQVVTVGGVNDGVEDGDQMSSIRVSIVDDHSHESFHDVEDQFADVMTIDDDGLAYVDERLLVVTGTPDGDQFQLTEADGLLTIELNGESLQIATSEYDKIRILASQGNDLVDASSVTSNTIVSLGIGNDTFLGGEGDDTVRAGSGRDSVAGGPGNDFIAAGPGIDSLYGDSGNDRIRSGNGADFANGGENDDRISGGGGLDTIIGGPGNDRLNGGAKSDSVNGGSGDDTVRGGRGRDTLVGGSDHDLIEDENGHTYVEGGDGDDTIQTGASEDTVRGGTGNDLILTGAGKDKLFGGSGRDILLGGNDMDRVNGEADDDIVISGYTSLSITQLSTISNEWASSRDYPTRVANVRHGAGRTGDRLNTSSLVGRDRAETQTVFASGTAEKISGGTDDDLFFGGVSSDALDRSVSEQLDLI